MDTPGNVYISFRENEYKSRAAGSGKPEKIKNFFRETRFTPLISKAGSCIMRLLSVQG